MATIEQKLARLKNRSTLYEIAAENVQGARYLAGYSRRTAGGLLAMINKNTNEWLMRVGAAVIHIDNKEASFGGYHLFFTGRTQREAIVQGELPWFAGDAGIPIGQ